ncbi:hypothetical protein [Prescottella equi]|uniref:hypothetical protein n=1 Tax=Rhodococcus hoagii TaxID=43767 RepID=UPI00158597EA|nr:hypothetical protein [Prescottella equi]BCN58362.1 hypothetical protein RE9427_17320 [Prescottella equi]
MGGDSKNEASIDGSVSTDDGAKLMRIFDASLVSAGKLVTTRVDRLRERHPRATNAQLVKKLNTTYMSSVTATGAASGAAAAVPGAGTAAMIATVGADTSWFLTASITHVLSVLRVHGIRINDLEHQKAVVLTVLAGGNGSLFAGKAAGRTAPHLGKLLANAVPATTLRQINRVLGVNFVTKWGTKQGILVIGRAAPFGIGAALGAGGNALMATAVVKATNKAVSVALADCAPDDDLYDDLSIVSQ